MLYQMKPEANANDWMTHSHTGSRVICRETASFCPASGGNDPAGEVTKTTTSEFYSCFLRFNEPGHNRGAFFQFIPRANVRNVFFGLFGHIKVAFSLSQ